MLSSVLKMGLSSIDQLAANALRKRQGDSSQAHPLAAYPGLRRLLADAEQNGMLAAERRRLMQRRLTH